jgi:hypothetical protein
LRRVPLVVDVRRALEEHALEEAEEALLADLLRECEEVLDVLPPSVRAHGSAR